MAGEPVIYMRGPFAFDVERLISSQFVADAKIALDLSIDQLDAISNELSSSTGFLDESSVHEIVGSIVTSEDHAKSLSRLIFKVSKALWSSKVGTEHLMRRLGEWQESNDNPNLLSAEQLAQLQQRLPIILRPYTGIVLQAKAGHLADATGLRLDELEIICDLRPVFDEKRTRVEGIIPFTILKVVCNGVDGLPLSLEAILSEDEVGELAKKAESAMVKLKYLKELLRVKEIPIPSVGMTKNGE
jgi:hypothetical protein